MHTYTEAVILSQIQILGGKRMIHMLSEEFGRISAGTSLHAAPKSGALLALKPFTRGMYGIRKSRAGYRVESAEVISSHYRISDSVEKYAGCAWALEFAGKLLPEDAPAPALFRLLAEFLGMMEARAKSFDTLTLAYVFGALRIWGALPETDRCAACGEGAPGAAWFSARDGGVVCDSCAEARKIAENHGGEGLLYPVNFGIVKKMKYFAGHELKDFENLALEGESSELLWRMIRGHLSYHLDIGRLKAEGLMRLGGSD
ncbi:MAG: DNA repair protein RecO [Clostridiales Family XIII bacterium]|jgi:DNA repair protein RecO (recombination protein O)|nr:DNA repair protein RecO [Clostridiales Family XIII bacterium]